MVAAGDNYLVLDLPGADVKAVGDALKGQPVLLVNGTAPEDSLRTACYANMVHSGPSERQMMDAFAQYLRSMNWLNVLVLVGQDLIDAPPQPLPPCESATSGSSTSVAGTRKGASTTTTKARSTGTTAKATTTTKAQTSTTRISTTTT